MKLKQQTDSIKADIVATDSQKNIILLVYITRYPQEVSQESGGEIPFIMVVNSEKIAIFQRDKTEPVSQFNTPEILLLYEPDFG